MNEIVVRRWVGGWVGEWGDFQGEEAEWRYGQREKGNRKLRTSP